MEDKDIRQSMKTIICNYLDHIANHQTKPYKHFLYDSIEGLITKGDTNLSKIAKTIPTNVKRHPK